MSEQKGLYNKYMVIKVVDDTIVENCFILKPDSDPAAVKALQAYAAATENKVLAADLYAWVGKPMQKPLTHKEAEDLLQSGVRVWTEERGYYEEPEGVNSGYLETEGYGTRWRCWASEPTDEERAAAPWEE